MSLFGMLGKQAKKQVQKRMGEQKGGEKQLPKPMEVSIPGAFKHGGMVKKTGFAKVHKGERVLTKRQQKQHMKSRSKY
jgi:hypothetical protein